VGANYWLAESNGGREEFIAKAVQSTSKSYPQAEPAEDKSSPLSIESLLKFQQLIFAGSPLWIKRPRILTSKTPVAGIHRQMH
jgi:hypothetical protein